LAVTLGVCAVAKRFQLEKFLLAPAIFALASCLFLTQRQLSFWRNDIALFRHTIEVTPPNPTAHFSLGYALLLAGKNDEAMKEFRATLAIQPDHEQALIYWADLLAVAGKFDEALKHYYAALQLNPRSIAAHNGLGTLFAHTGHFDDALKEYAESEKIAPLDWHAPFLTGKALLKAGRDAEAIACFQKVLTLAPYNPHALIFIAQVLASDENAQIRNGQMALALAQKANEISGGTRPDALDAIAMAQAELGDFDEAKKTAQLALDFAAAFDVTNDVPLINQQLELYKTDKKFRQSFAATNLPSK
jgi:tetratricopeptide (TPR) repeat protein